MNIKLDKSDGILLVIYFSISLIMDIFGYYQEDNMLIEYLVDLPMRVIIALTLIYIYGFILIPNYIVQNRNYPLFLTFGIAALILFGGILYSVGYLTAAKDWSKFPRLIEFIFRAIDTGSDTLAFPLGILLTKKFYEGQTQLLQIERQQKENELKLLRSQMNPHFLFNNLNTLDALIDRNTQKAKGYISRLALIYRYLIKTKDAEVMELADEIELAENYIYLINTRFGSDYEFTIDKNIDINDCFIPTGTIQALLENVVKHNKSQYKTPIKTSIVIAKNWLIIANQKSKLNSNEESFGTGLENLRARYALLSDQQMHIQNTETTFEVRVPILTLSQS